MNSRVTTTRVLAEAIAASDSLPTFLAGNGIGIYGDHGSQPVTEMTDSRGDALLTRVSRAVAGRHRARSGCGRPRLRAAHRTGPSTGAASR